jgi:voltage-gated potassium channel
VADYLRANQKAFVIIESNPFLSDSASRRNIAVINADPTMEESLYAAQIDMAGSLIACLDDDAHNVMIVLVANDLKKQSKCRGDLRIIARAENQSAISRVESAGANYVLSPSTIAGKAMAELSTEEDEQNRERISEFWK